MLTRNMQSPLVPLLLLISLFFSNTHAFSYTAMQPLTGSEGYLLSMHENTKDFLLEFHRNDSYVFVGRIRSTLVSSGDEFEMARATFPPGQPPLASLVYNPGFTDSTKIWGYAAKKSHTPVLTYATAVFSREENPSIVQLDSDDIRQGAAIAAFFHQMGWERVAILKQDTSDVVAILQSFLDHAVHLQVMTHQTSGPPILKRDLDNVTYTGFELGSQCEQIKKSGAYIILLLAFDYNTADFLFALRDAGLTEPPYQIIMNSHTVRVKVQFYPQLLPPPARTKTLWELSRLLKGVAYISVGTPNYTAIADIKQRWTQLALTKIHPDLNTVPTFDLRMGFFQAVGYDTGTMTSRSLRQLFRLQRDCGVCYTFNLAYNSTLQAQDTDPCWQMYLAINTTIQQSQFAHQPPSVHDCKMLAYSSEGYTLYQIIVKQEFPSIAIPFTRFDAKGVKIAPFSIAHGIDDDMEVVALQNENGTFVLNDPNKPMVWRSGLTDIPRDSDRLRLNEQLLVKLDATMIVLSFSIAFISSWVASILIEQLIFYYMSRKDWIIWWILASISISVGSWASIMVGFTSSELTSNSGLTPIPTTYFTVPFFTSLLVILPSSLFSLLAMFSGQRNIFRSEIAVAAAKKDEKKHNTMIDSQLVMDAESMFSKSNCIRALTSSGIFTLGVVGVHYIGLTGLDVPCSFRISEEGPVSGVFLGIVFSSIGMLMLFHFRRSHYRYISNLFMAGSVACVHFMSNMSVSWYYNGAASISNTFTLSRVTVQLIASVSFAILSFAFIILNVIRLRLSRDTFEADLKNLRQDNARLLSEINYLQRVRDRFELYLRILNVLRFPSKNQRSDHFMFDVLKYFKEIIEGGMSGQDGAERLHELIKIDSQELKNNSRTRAQSLRSLNSGSRDVNSSSTIAIQLANFASSASSSSSSLSNSKYAVHPNASSSSSSSSSSSHSILIERKLQMNPTSLITTNDLPLKTVMMHPIFFEFIKEIGIAQSSDEILSFLAEVQLFKKFVQSLSYSPSSRIQPEHIANNIYQHYLSEHALQPLNLSSLCTERIRRKFKVIGMKTSIPPSASSVVASSSASSASTISSSSTSSINENFNSIAINETLFDEVENEMNGLVSANLWTPFKQSSLFDTCVRLLPLLPTNITHHDGSSTVYRDSYESTSPEITQAQAQAQTVSVRTQLA